MLEGKMNIIDVTGPIRNGMWSMGELFPKPEVIRQSGYCEGFGEYFYTEIRGFHAQLGTYLETPAHFFGFEKSFFVDDIPLEKLVNLGCVVLHVNKDVSDPSVHHAITKDDLLSCGNAGEIKPGDCVVVATGWDRHWMDDAHFFSRSPYFTYDAMKWLIEKKPSIIASDTPAWENLSDPQGFFPEFYANNILMLAPLVNLSQVTAPRCAITILPLPIEEVAAAPVRAIVTEG